VGRRGTRRCRVSTTAAHVGPTRSQGLKTYEGFLLGYDSNSRAYRIFNVTTDYVKISCDAVFNETNDSPKEQVDIDLVDDEEAPCDALQRMTIDDIMPQDLSNQAQ
jgi:hypothetical protein